MAFENPIVGGEGGELIRESIKSPNFVTDVSGWIIRRDGSAEFYNVRIRADLEVGDTITIGPDSNPQVVLGSTVNHAFIQFPTNASFETSPGQIYADTGTVDDVVSLELYSGTAGGSFTNDSSIQLVSGDNGAIDDSIVIRGTTTEIQADLIYLNSNDVNVENEILVAVDKPDVNYPIRVASGRVNGGTNTVTLTGADAEITNTAATSTYLENGVAYSVDVQIQTRQSVGTSAAGTQRFDWKLWETTVGTTQLDNTIETWNKSVGNNLATEQFSFLFNYAGTTGSYTLRLSCADGGGADTLQVQSNTRYFMVVKRLGDPAKILGL